MFTKDAADVPYIDWYHVWKCILLPLVPRKATKHLLIFVSGPYSSDTPEGIQENVDRAVAAGKALMKKGHYVIVPHSMTDNWDLDTDLTWGHFMDNCIELLLRADAIYLLPDWRSSKGACIEEANAVASKKIIFRDMEEVPTVDLQ